MTSFKLCGCLWETWSIYCLLSANHTILDTHRGMLLSRLQPVSAPSSAFSRGDILTHMSFFKFYGCPLSNMVNLLSLLANHKILDKCLKSAPQISEETSTDWRAPSTTCRCCCNVDAVCTMCACIHSVSNPLSWSSLAWFLDFCKCRCEYNMHFRSFNPKWLLPLMVVPSLLESSFGIWCLWPWRFLQGSFSGFLMSNANGAENDECGWLSAGTLTQYPPDGLISVSNV